MVKEVVEPVVRVATSLSLTLTYVAVPVCGRARGCARRAGQYLQDQTIILTLILTLTLTLTLNLTQAPTTTPTLT